RTYRLALPHPHAVLLDQQANCAPGNRRQVCLWQPPRMLAYHIFVTSLVRQVRPFVGIVAMVVEFFRTVGIADITPLFGTNGMVVLVVRRDCGPAPRRLRIAQELY